ncbi:MAG: DUF4870 domain-containing protein [Terrimicrobiaceae bacterium]
METPPPIPTPDPTPDPTPVPTPDPVPVPIPDTAPVPQPPPSVGISDRQWIVFLHLSALGGFVLPSLGHIIGPLIIWLIKRPESAAIDEAGKNVLNFQISWTIWMFISVVVGFAGSCLVIPIIIPIGLGIAWLVFVILGAIKASNGETYTFPLTIKML